MSIRASCFIVLVSVILSSAGADSKGTVMGDRHVPAELEPMSVSKANKLMVQRLAWGFISDVYRQGKLR